MYYVHNIMVKIHNTTKDKILKLLLSNKAEQFTIREISNKIKVDYKTVYIQIKVMQEQKLLDLQKKGQTNLCSISKGAFGPGIYRAEYLRRQDLLNDKNLNVIYQDIKDDIGNPFFILLLFGSYAKGTQRKHSDIDLMLITENELVQQDIKQIINRIPLEIHLVCFTFGEFQSMLKTTEFNVGREADMNNIILFGTEAYYQLRC